MNQPERLQRALADKYEFVGDQFTLCKLLRSECRRLMEHNESLRRELFELKDKRRGI